MLVDLVEHVMLKHKDFVSSIILRNNVLCERKRFFGFCDFVFFFYHSVGAFHAHLKHKLDRIAIVDFDIHDGNGTRDIVGDHEAFLFTQIYAPFDFVADVEVGMCGAHGGSDDAAESRQTNCHSFPLKVSIE